MEAIRIRSAANNALELTAYSGHFATRHTHNSHYIDITRMKHEHTMAREAGVALAQRYTYDKAVDTVVCLDGSEVIGAFLARHLAKKDRWAVNMDKNINVITPEYDAAGPMIFRDNLLDMVRDKAVLLLVSSVNSGKTIRQALECVEYYGGTVQGIAAVFSSLPEVEGLPVYSIFSPDDVPGYSTAYAKECPLCKAGKKIDGLVNSYGLSKL